MHSRRRGRIALAAAVAALVMGLVGLLGYVVLLASDGHLTYDVDQGVVKDWNTKLAPAISDLNALSNISGLKPAEPARVYPCSVDSGELFDLEAGRYWDAADPGRTVEYPPATVTPSTAHAFLEIIRRLKAMGWRVTETAEYLDMKLPPGLSYDTIDLTRTANGVKTSLTIQVFDDGLNAGLDFAGAKKACGGH